jgi:branched-chain amino acid aminotransferase
MAKLEATRRGFDEALFVDDTGLAVEATGENLFLVRNGRVTAVRHADALPGITQDTVAQISGAESRRALLEEVLDADEVFLTGTSAEVVPVVAIEERHYGVGPLTAELRNLYQDLVHGRLTDRASWLTVVS